MLPETSGNRVTTFISCFTFVNILEMADVLEMERRNLAVAIDTP